MNIIPANPPFEVLQEGGCTLYWGHHEDGRWWLKSECKACGAISPSIGLKGGLRPTSGAANLREGYRIGYVRLRVRRSRKGWCAANYTISYISDFCQKCRRSISTYNYGRRRLGNQFPDDSLSVLLIKARVYVDRHVLPRPTCCGARVQKDKSQDRLYWRCGFCKKLTKREAA